ncbi:MAG: hypothetical protein ACF8QF_12605 [Phycisphaerales bacterium]
MLKFLRKYNVWILAIGGTLLMIAFVAPQAINQLFGAGSPGTQVVATYAGGSVTLRERQEAARELQIMEQLGLGALGLVRSARDESDDAVHWILLNRLADRAELIGGPEDGRSFLEYAARQVASAQASQYAEFGTEEYRNFEDLLVQYVSQTMEGAREALLAEGVMAPEQMNLLLARARGVYRMYETYFEAAKLSDLEAVEAAREALDQVGVNYLIIRSTRVVPRAPRPTPEQFEEFFEKYKAVDRGEPPHGFGYLLRPGVKLEWMHIPRAPIAREVAVDPVEANAYWRQNRGQYPGEWAEAQRDVIEDLRDREIDGILDEINRVVASEVRRAESPLPLADGVRQLPEDWALTRPSLRAIALRVQDVLRERYAIEVDQPNVIPFEAGWWTRDMFSRFTGFQDAAVQVGPERIGTEDIVFGVRELTPGSASTFQAGLVYGPAIEPESGDIYFFRVTDIRPEQAPESMDVDNVRSLVGQDIQRWNAYEMLLGEMDQMREMASEGGLEAISQTYAFEIEKEYAVSRTGINPAADFDLDQDFVRDAILDHAEQLNPKQLAIQQPIENRLVIVPLPYALAIAVVEIIDQRPLSQELFRQREPRAAAEAQARLIAETPGDWPYSFAELSRTMNLEWRRGEGPDRDEPAGDEAPAQANAG